MLLAQQLLLLAVDVSPNCSEVPEDSEEIYTEYFNYFYHITTVKDFLISLFGLSEHDLKSYGISQELLNGLMNVSHFTPAVCGVLNNDCKNIDDLVDDCFISQKLSEGLFCKAMRNNSSC